MSERAEERGVRGLWRALDAVLRGRCTDGEAPAEGGVRVATGRLLALGLALGALYGTSVGAYAICHGGDRPALQFVSAAVKLPLSFGLTLLVTFPSLYVFATLMRATLGGRATLRLLLVASLTHLAVLASLGPVFAFFVASTESYPFLLLLHVLFCAIGGILSLLVLRRATVGARAPGAGAAVPHSRLLSIWFLLYGIVGAQMGWLLRPFLGMPGRPFAWICPRESNFFEAVVAAWRGLLGG